MRVSIVFFLLIIQLFLFLSFNEGRSSRNSCCSRNLIEEVCKNFTQRVPYLRYKFCIDSLEAGPGSRCANRHELGLIALNLLLNNATDTQCYIKQLLGKSKGLNPIIQSNLETCLELYLSGIIDLKVGISAYESSGGGIFGVSAISWSGIRCKDGMRANKGAVPPLKKRNNDILHLSAIGIGFTSND